MRGGLGSDLGVVHVVAGSVLAARGRGSRAGATLARALREGNLDAAAWALQSCPRVRVRAPTVAERGQGWRVILTLDEQVLAALDVRVVLDGPVATWPRRLVEVWRARAADPSTRTSGHG